MKNLGCYIIPQIFENSILKYYPDDNIQGINSMQIIEDLDVDVEYIYRSIEYNNEQWKLRFETVNKETKDLVWNKNGKYLGIFKG